VGQAWLSLLGQGREPLAGEETELGDEEDVVGTEVEARESEEKT
jgi:hypothetical protein